MKKTKTLKRKFTLVPVESILDMIEEATARGMQRGAQIVLQEMQREQIEEPKKDSDIFLGMGASDD